MIYTVQNKYLKVRVAQFGAVLTSIQSQESGHEFLWQGDKSVWNGQSPILFPIIGKLLDDKCRIDGREYEIIRHGLARHREFQCIAERENELVFLQKSDEETKKAYPYDYELYITFTVSPSRIWSKTRMRKPCIFHSGHIPRSTARLGTNWFLKSRKRLSANALTMIP